MRSRHGRNKVARHNRVRCPEPLLGMVHHRHLDDLANIRHGRLAERGGGLTRQKYFCRFKKQSDRG